VKIRLANKILQRDCDGATYRFGTLVRARRRYRSWKCRQYGDVFPLSWCWRSYADYRVWQQRMWEELCRRMQIPATVLRGEVRYSSGLKSVAQVRAENALDLASVSQTDAEKENPGR
jgi:hypothetical protein